MAAYKDGWPSAPLQQTPGGHCRETTRVSRLIHAPSSSSFLREQADFLGLCPLIPKNKFTCWGECQGRGSDELILKYSTNWLSGDKTSRCFFTTGLLTKLIGCFSVKNTKSQKGHQKRKFVGDKKKHTIVGSIIFFEQGKSEFSGCAKWLKVCQSEDKAERMDFVKGYIGSIWLWCPPTPFKHSVQCKWSKLRNHLISTNINSDMKNETNSSDRIMITAAWH